jgi:hypothetical protein
MTTDQLQQKHLQAIENYTDFVNTNKKAAAKQCALITIEHTIGVLKKMKYKLILSSQKLMSIEIANMSYSKFNNKIDTQISELQKQKEQL